MQKKPKAVIFDMDGLMFDTEALFSIVQEEMTRKRGKMFTLEIKNKMMGQKPLDAIKVMLAELGIDEDPEKVSQERDETYVELLRTQSQPMPGLFDFLKVLDERGIRKAIASSANREWIDILLHKFGISNEFEIIVSGQDVKTAKPSPEIYLKAVAELQLEPQDCLVLEDAIHGIRSAKAAGCIAVAVPSHFTEHQDFSEADFVVKSLDDPALRIALGI